MPRAPKGDPTTSEYWDDRVKSAQNEEDMIFIDGRRGAFWERVRAQLRVWRTHHVLDVACGFGKFAAEFEPPYYRGIDFSLEMLKLARAKFPHHRFSLKSAREEPPEPADRAQYDVIFEVNSLRSLGMTAEDFINKYTPYARVAVACLEADEFRIANIYPKR